tara:strand:- start:596 stop:1150 length:555 start_codon:yes stop_codon:yes gene_type:complete
MKTKLLVLLIICSFSNLYSQDSIPKIKKYWIDSGIGITTKIDDQNYLAFNMSLNYVQNKAMYKLRFLGVTEFNLFGQSESVVTIGALIGKHYSNKFLQISFLGGLGIAVNEELTTNIIGSTGSGWFSSSLYETKKSTSLSIPLEIEFFFKPIKFYGIGISLFADINSSKPSFGILLKSGFGKFR